MKTEENPMFSFLRQEPDPEKAHVLAKLASKNAQITNKISLLQPAFARSNP